MEDRIEIAATSELNNGEMKMVEAGDVYMTLVRDSKGEFHCLQAMCPHQDIPLAEGDLIGDEIQCAGHGWKFNIKTGECNANPYCEAMIYNIEVEKDKIYFINNPDKGI